MQIKIKEVPQQLVLAYLAGINIWMWGKPALGKTFIGEEFGRIMAKRVPGFVNTYLYVPTLGPTDIQAAMPDVKARTLEFCNNAKLPNRYTTPDAKGVLHLGELANGDPTVVKLLQPYVNNEDMSGVLRKPKGIMVLADSNRLQDKAGSIQQMRAMLSRFVHWDAYSEPEDDMAFATRSNWHPIVLSFMKDNPHLIDNYEEVFESAPGAGDPNARIKRTEEGKRGVWSNKRGLERLSELEFAAENAGATPHSAFYFGSIGSAAGAQFLATRSMYSMLHKIEEIVANPTGIDLPPSPSARFAQCLMLSIRSQQDDLDAVVKYSQRMPEDMQILMLQRLAKRIGKDLKPARSLLKWAADNNVTDLLAGA